MISEEIKVKLKPDIEFRPCYIIRHNKSKIKALFHCWTEIDYGLNGMNVTKTAAIVEVEDGSVTLIHPQAIKFVSGIFNEYSWVEEEEYKKEEDDG